MQRIIPGVTLKNEYCIDKRISAFIDVWENAHINSSNPDLYETYLDAVIKAENSKYIQNDIPVLRQAADKMVTLCSKLYEKYPEHILLHTDLHGDNLLKNNQNEYIIIDPHGRIGPVICDLGRFIANEYFDAKKDDRVDVIKYVIREISSKLDLPVQDVAYAFYIDITLITCWGAADGIINSENVHTHEYVLQEDFFE